MAGRWKPSLRPAIRAFDHAMLALPPAGDETLPLDPMSPEVCRVASEVCAEASWASNLSGTICQQLSLGEQLSKGAFRYTIHHACQCSASAIAQSLSRDLLTVLESKWHSDVCTYNKQAAELQRKHKLCNFCSTLLEEL